VQPEELLEPLGLLLLPLSLPDWLLLPLWLLLDPLWLLLLDPDWLLLLDPLCEDELDALGLLVLLDGLLLDGCEDDGCELDGWLLL
jgi:hypothetical protein